MLKIPKRSGMQRGESVHLGPARRKCTGILQVGNKSFNSNKPGCGTTHACSLGRCEEGAQVSEIRRQARTPKERYPGRPSLHSSTSSLSFATPSVHMAWQEGRSTHLLLCTRTVRFQQAVHIDLHNCHILPSSGQLDPVSIPLTGDPCLPRTFSKHSLHSRKYMSIACTLVPQESEQSELPLAAKTHQTGTKSSTQPGSLPLEATYINIEFSQEAGEKGSSRMRAHHDFRPCSNSHTIESFRV